AHDVPPGESSTCRSQCRACAPARCLTNRAPPLRNAPVGRPLKVEQRADRDDAVGIDAAMAAVVMLLDVAEVNGVRDARPLIEFASVAPQVGVVDQPSQVRSEEHTSEL